MKRKDKAASLPVSKEKKKQRLDSKPTGGKNSNNSEAAAAAASSSEDQALAYAVADSFALDEDCVERAKRFFEWIIAPITAEVFWEEYWQKKPLVILRKNPKYYQGWFSTEIFKKILLEKEIQYTTDIDIAEYKDGKRYTHNPEGRATSQKVWEFFKNGSSIRILRPHEHVDRMWQMVSLFEEYIGSGGGANVYITPAAAQGFAPHYDDIEAFVLQMEGSKNWKLRTPTEAEMLARAASPDFTFEEAGEPDMEVSIRAGDFLYMPRGWIHWAQSPKDEPSLHVTLSCGHRDSFYDMIGAALPTSVEFLMEDDQSFRECIPARAGRYMGLAHSDEKKHKAKREEFITKTKELLQKVVDEFPYDMAVDHLGKQYLHDRLPPFLLPQELDLMSGGKSAPKKIKDTFKVRLVRGDVARLVIEEGIAMLYHCMDNERIYHAVEPTFLPFDPELAPGIEYLINSYPKFVKVKNLPLDTRDERKTVANALFLAKILMVAPDTETDTD